MATQEIVLKFRGDESQIKATLAGLKSAYSSTLAEITRQTKAEAQAAAALQRQRSSALITIWKADTRSHESEQKRRTAEAAREERVRVQAALSLQRQRSAALIAAWRAEQREQVRIAREAAREVEAAQSRRGAFLSGAIGGLTALVGVSVISEIRQAGAAWLDYSSKLETTRIAFTTMLGSAQLAQEHLNELQQFALKTPFQFGELIDASQRMQALGFNAAQVVPILTDVGNAVAAAGGGSERLDRVVLALSQMQSKGKVATQELNQLAESGIGGFKILEQALGKSRAELVKMVEQGEISSKVFLDAFQKFSQQNFGGLMEAQSKTFSGAMSNIKDALLQTSATAFAPLFEKLSQTAKAFADAATSSKDFQDKLKTVGSVASTIFDGLKEVILAFRDAIRIAFAAISGQIHALIEGFRALGHATTAVFFAAFAAAKIARGDVKGALEAQRIAQQELQLATDAAKKAIVAQGEALRAVITVYKEAEVRAKALANAQAKVGVDVGIGSGILRKKGDSSPNTPTSTKTGSGSDPAAAARSIAEIQLRATLDGIQLEEEGIERSLRRRVIEYAQYAAEIEVLENKRHQAVLDGLVQEQKAANGLKDLNTRAVATAEIKARLSQENNKHQSELLKLSDKTFERDKQIAAALEGFREKQIEQLRQLLHGNKTALDDANDFIVAYEKMGGVLDENQKKWLRFDAVLIQSKESMRKLLELLREAAQEGIGKVPGLTEDQQAAIAGAGADAAAGAPPPEVTGARSAIDQLFEAVNENLTGSTQTAALAGLEAMTSAFLDLGHAVGQAVEAFVLYGSAGTSVRKVTAEILAGIARQAAVKAVFELAEGFAALALAFFGLPNAGPSATAHFTAAAIYGGIAGVAAIAGRAVAGNAFQQSTGAAGARSGGGTNTTNSGTPKPVDLDRSTQNAQAITRELTFKVNGDAVVEKWVEDFNLNGRTRITVMSER